MGRVIRTGMRVRMKDGLAKGMTGTVVDDFDGRTVKWDGGTITVEPGTKTREGEAHLERINS